MATSTKSKSKSSQPAKKKTKKAAKPGNNGQSGTYHETTIPLSKIKPNRKQPRDMARSNGSIKELANSIKENGLLSAIGVTPAAKGSYSIVFGERRFQAVKQLKAKDIRCVVMKGLDAQRQYELALVENLLREDLSPVESAKAFRHLIDKCGHTQASLAKMLGISTPAVNYSLSLLKLDKDLQQSIDSGELSPTQGRAIVQEVNKIKEPKQRKQAMDSIKKNLAEQRNNGQPVSSKKVKAISKEQVSKTRQTGKSRSRKNTYLQELKKKTWTKAQENNKGIALQAFKKIQAAMKPLGKTIKSKAQLQALCEMLYLHDKNVAQKIRENYCGGLQKLHSELTNVALRAEV